MVKLLNKRIVEQQDNMISKKHLSDYLITKGKMHFYNGEIWWSAAPFITQRISLASAAERV